MGVTVCEPICVGLSVLSDKWLCGMNKREDVILASVDHASEVCGYPLRRCLGNLFKHLSPMFRALFEFQVLFEQHQQQSCNLLFVPLSRISGDWHFNP